MIALFLLFISIILLCTSDFALSFSCGTYNNTTKMIFQFSGTAKRRLHKPVDCVYPTNIQDSAESAWAQWGRKDVSIRFTQVWILQFLVQEVKVQLHLISRKWLCKDQEWQVHFSIKLFLILTFYLFIYCKRDFSCENC